MTVDSATFRSRLAISLAAWLFAGFGVFTSVVLASAGLATERAPVVWLIAAIPLFAWIALAAMTLRWIQDRRCHRFWPVAGSICGVLSTVAFAVAFIVYVTAVLLAVYLVWWHLRPISRIGDAAASH